MKLGGSIEGICNFAAMPIKTVHIQNFKSIREAEVELSQINVLIGPNGVGKSNFIGFFKLVNEIFVLRLQHYVKTNGRSESFLYYGSKRSPFIFGELKFNYKLGQGIANRYSIKLSPTQDYSFILEESSDYLWNVWHNRKKSGLEESWVVESDKKREEYLRSFLSSLQVFHFHDTSKESSLKIPNNLNDNRALKSDGSNLAALLYKIKETEPKLLGLIERTIHSVAPFFSHFDLAPDELDKNKISLVWKEQGSDHYFDAHSLSDGTLRFICLTALLLQPNPAPIIIIDEPELGLHPFAIAKLAGMIKSVSTHSQIIISTQSITLLNHFSPDDVIVVERENEQSVFKRQNEEQLASWLEEYSLGELWDKNVIGGRP